MTRHPRGWSWLPVLLLFTLAVPAAAAPPRSIPGELLVGYRKVAGPSERASARAQARVRELKHFAFINVDHVHKRLDVVAVGGHHQVLE